MASVNKVHIIGNTGQDPEVKYMPSGVAVCNLSVATSRQWKDKNSGEKQEEVEWHRLSFFDRLAEIVGEYVQKGDPLYVEGRLKTRKYTDKDGVERYTTEIIVENMQLLGQRRDGGGERQEPQGRQQQPQTRQAPQGRGQAQQRSAPPQRQQPAQRGGGNSFDDMDSDIPF